MVCALKMHMGLGGDFKPIFTRRACQVFHSVECYGSVNQGALTSPRGLGLSGRGPVGGLSESETWDGN